MQVSIGSKGQLQSSYHARGIIELELDGLSRLLESMLTAFLEAYFRKLVPWTDQDREFLQTRIRDLFNARFKVSQAFLLDYFKQRGLRLGIEEFYREAQSLFSQVMRRIQIMVLENRISNPQLPDIGVDDLLRMDEGQRLEFKSTFQWDIRRRAENKELRLEVISTIAGFNNTDGGYLLIGVQDDRSIFGLEKDYSLLKGKKDWDRFCLTLTQEIENKTLKNFAANLKISKQIVDGHDICLVKTNIGEDTIWVKEKLGEAFYIRAQNSTRALSPRESAEYIRKKWHPKG